MKVVLNSLPKSGTNMVQKCLELASIPYSGKSLAASSNFGKYGLVKKLLRQPRSGEVPVIIGLEVPVAVSPCWIRGYLHGAHGYVSGHAAYSAHYHSILKSEGYKTIQVVRHPCAVLSSWANYIAEPGYYWSKAHNHLAQMSFEERVDFLLYGGEINNFPGLYYRGFGDVLSQLQGWIDAEDVLTVRFEDMVGKFGGGNDELQRLTVEKIFQHTGFPLEDKIIEDVVVNLYGGTHTFRKGSINGWKESMSDKLTTQIVDELSNVPWLSQLNYKW